MLHRIIYEIADLDAVLLAFSRADCKALLHALKLLAIPLVAVTMPFKERVLPYLDGCSADVQSVGAANTIIQRDGKFYGHNTDMDGICYALRQYNLARKNVLILGAGASAKTVAYAMQDQAPHLFWLNRDNKRSALVSKKFGGQCIAHADLAKRSLDFIVNATPLGMMPHQEAMPLERYEFQSQQVLFDLIYCPSQTRLMATAKKAGAKIISGLDMFVMQAIKQVELWREENFSAQIIREIFSKSLPHLNAGGYSHDAPVSLTPQLNEE